MITHYKTLANSRYVNVIQLSFNLERKTMDIISKVIKDTLRRSLLWYCLVMMLDS